MASHPDLVYTKFSELIGVNTIHVGRQGCCEVAIRHCQLL